MTAHHPSPARLVSYASDGLPVGPRSAIGAHLAMCAPCARVVAGLEAGEGGLVETLPETPLSAGLLQRALQTLDAPSSPPPRGDHLGGPEFAHIPSDLNFLDRRRFHLGGWVAHLDAPRDGGWRTYLLFAAPGVKVPAHGHRGAELLTVLHGAFDDGRRFETGAFCENPAGMDHGMQVVGHEPCLCLVSTEAPLQWRRAGAVIAGLLDV